MRDFILANTAVVSPPLLPELRLRLATELTELWRATESWLDGRGVPPPFWAFAWPGGQALARYVLDRPEVVAGKRVLDFATGSGLVAIAAALAGAADVLAVDVDAFALSACSVNAELNGLRISTLRADPIGGPPPDADVVLAGDTCYEQPTAAAAAAWMRRCAREGRDVLLGDPGRTYLPRDGLVRVAEYLVVTLPELESREQMRTTVWRFV